MQQNVYKSPCKLNILYLDFKNLIISIVLMKLHGNILTIVEIIRNVNNNYY